MASIAKTDVATWNAFLERALPVGCMGTVQAIGAGDERHLRASEGRGLENAVISVRRSSGAGRSLARSLCAQMGHAVDEIPRSQGRYPVWPSGIVGSISHDPEFAAAAVGLGARVSGIGIDIEPGERLSPDIAAIVASAEETAAFSDIEFHAKAIFCIKEAVFKATYPVDGTFLDFRDIRVDRVRSVALTSLGRWVHWRLYAGSRIIAVAWH